MPDTKLDTEISIAFIQMLGGGEGLSRESR